MVALSARRRKALSASAFVYPKQRKYPIDTKARARAALSYGARKTTFGRAAVIRAKVYKRYPSLKRK